MQSDIARQGKAVRLAYLIQVSRPLKGQLLTWAFIRTDVDLENENLQLLNYN